MKKFLATLLTVSLSVLMLAGCGSTAATNATTAAPENVAATTAGENGTQASAGTTTVTPGVLTMATNAAFPPYEYYEGTDIVGIDAEIAAAVAAKLGLTLKIEDMEFDSIITAVQTGKADIGFAGMTVTEDRLKSINFSDSYATGIQVIIVKEDSTVASAGDLAGKKIGVQLATTGDIYASDEFGADNVEQYNKGADAVMALVNGKVDAVIIDNEPAKAFVAANKGLKIVEESYAIEDYAACISKDKDALLADVNKALADLKADGTLDAIVEKYIPAK